MKTRLLAILMMITMILGTSFTTTVFAENKVEIEAVGFFSHGPMRSTRNAIESTCAKFGDKVELKLYDETKKEGIDFMTKKGLSGHIPMRLYINGSNTVTIDGDTVSFKDFVGREWTADELEKAIALALGGADISANATDETESNNNSMVIIIISCGVVAIAVILFFLFKSNKKDKAKKKTGRKA